MWGVDFKHKPNLKEKNAINSRRDFVLKVSVPGEIPEFVWAKKEVFSSAELSVGKEAVLGYVSVDTTAWEDSYYYRPRTAFEVVVRGAQCHQLAFVDACTKLEEELRRDPNTGLKSESFVSTPLGNKIYHDNYQSHAEVLYPTHQKEDQHKLAA